MIEVYLADTDNISLSGLNLSKVTPQRRAKIERLLHEESKRQSLAAGLLYSHVFGNTEYKTGKYGKPYVEGSLRFSLAHSGKFAVMTVCDNAEIGCDIEPLREADYEKIGRLVLCDSERELLNHSNNRQKLFFELWTKKEAFIKCIGEGFHFNCASLDLSGMKNSVDYNGTTYFFKKYMRDGYVIMLCSTESDFPYKITTPEFG